MCGIAGYFNARPNLDLLKSMISQVEHRGPDGFGYYIDNQAGLAHARLSIIDLEGGAQPIHNEDQTIWVTFNGEIYNYLELRMLLEQYGHTFYTNTDTEVIIHAYEQFSVDCFAMFNGQFSIALWDNEAKIGLLARDRVGIQPLFYAEGPEENSFYFGSEVKALFANKILNQGFNTKQLANSLKYWSPTPGYSVFNMVYEIDPGTCMVITETGSSVHHYWDHSYSSSSVELTESVADLREHMFSATSLRLRSDVDVGAYLSGGVDSSIITNIAATLRASNAENRLRTFSIAFDDEQYDESKYQDEVAHRLNMDHTRFLVRPTDIANSFYDVVWHAEKPMLRTAPIPMFLLSKKVKESGVKVVLTGEGADEVFAGYDIFREAEVRKAMATDPDNVSRINQMISELYPWMGDKMLTSSTDYLRMFFGDGSRNYQDPHFSHEPRWKASGKVQTFFSNDIKSSAMQAYAVEALRTHRNNELLTRAQYLEFRTLFQGYLISTQGDRMLMANGVEGRFPFLDPNVVDFGNSLPNEHKLEVYPDGGMTEKLIVKTLADALPSMPESVSRRKKQPYMAPDGSSFYHNGREHSLVSALLEQDYGYFNMRKVEILRKKMAAGKATGFADNMAFMGILSTQALHELYMEDGGSLLPTVDNHRFNIEVNRID